MRKRTPLLVAIGLLFAVPASALPPEKEKVSYYARDGFYLSAQGVYALEFFDTDDDFDDNVPGSTSADNSLGAAGKFGYRFHPHFAGEVHGEWLRRFDIDGDIGDVAEIRGGMFTANAKVYALTNRFQPFAYVGIGGGFIDVENLQSTYGVAKNTGGFISRYGAGFDYYFSGGVGFTGDVSYVLPTGGLWDYPYLSTAWGFFLRF